MTSPFDIETPDFPGGAAETESLSKLGMLGPTEEIMPPDPEIQAWWQHEEFRKTPNEIKEKMYVDYFLETHGGDPDFNALDRGGQQAFLLDFVQAQKPPAEFGRVMGAYPVGMKEGVRNGVHYLRTIQQMEIENLKQLPHMPSSYGERMIWMTGDALPFGERPTEEYFKKIDRLNEGRTALDDAREVLPHEDQLLIEAEAKRLEAEEGLGPGGAMERATLEHLVRQREAFEQDLGAAEESEFLATPEEYKVSSGLLEDASRAAGGSTIAITTGAAASFATGNPAIGAFLSTSIMFPQIGGAWIQDARANGIEDPEKLALYGTAVAALESPVEFLGDLVPFVRMMGISGRLPRYLSFLCENAGINYGEEFIQSNMEQTALIIALNPDLKGQKLLDHIKSKIPEMAERAHYEGQVGAIVGTGTASVMGLPGLVSPRQRAVNSRRKKMLEHLVNDWAAGKIEAKEAEQRLVAELKKAGFEVQDAEAGDVLKTLRQRIKLRKPIESEKRDAIETGLKEAYGDKASDYMALFDSVARARAEREGVSPDAWYEREFGEFRKETFAEFQEDRQQGVFQPADKVDEQQLETAKQTAVQVNEAAPGYDITFDGVQDRSIINKPPLYQFTAQAGGPVKKGTFSVESLDAQTVQRGLEAMAEKLKGRVYQDAEPMTVGRLNREVSEYKGTGGVASEAKSGGFKPAFMDSETGKMYESLDDEGSPSVVHDLDGLPDEVILGRDKDGYVTKAKPSLESGFTKDGKFYSRQEAVDAQRGTIYQDDQKEKPPYRGAVSNFFGQGPATMHAFENDNPSTVIHELGHIITRALAQERSGDYYELASWAGVSERRAAKGLDSWTTPELERVAKGFELYCMEGVAPTHRLQSVFQRMKQWLVDTYQAVASLRLDKELTDGVRNVFDRMVASEMERSEDIARDVGEWLLVDDQAAQPALDPKNPDYGAVQAVAKSRVISRVKKKRAGHEKRLKAQIKRDALKDWEGTEYHKLTEELKKSGGFDKAILKDALSDNRYARLASKIPGKVRAGGINPHTFAASNDFSGLDALVDYLLDAPTKKQFIADYFNTYWNEYQASLGEENTRLVYEVLDEQVRIITKLSGKTPKAQTKTVIRKTTGQVSDEDYRKLVQSLRRDERTARTAFAEGMKQGRYEATLKAVKKQREQVRKIYQAKKDQAEKARIDKRMKRHWKSKAIPVEYRQQLSAFLSEYYNVPKSFRAEPERALFEFLQSKAENDEQTVAAIFLELDSKPRQRRNDSGYRIPLNIAEKRQLARIADMIAHLGKIEKRAVGLVEKAEFRDQLQDMITTAYTAWNKAAKEPEGGILLREKRSVVNRVGDAGRSFLAMLKQAEFLFEALDGWETNGPNATLFHQIKRAEDDELAMGGEFFNRLEAMFKPFGGRKWAGKKFTLPGTEKEFTKEQLVMIALNSGNDGNRAALIHGNGFTDAQIDHVVNDLLTDPERQLVHEVWALLEDMFPALDNVHRQLVGVGLKRVEGNYFPLVFDPYLSNRADRYKELADVKNLFLSTYQRNSVEAGHRMIRTGGKMPVQLTFSIIGRHIQNAIHDATHQIPVRNVQRVISSPEYQAMINDTFGQPYYKHLRGWLQHVARPAINIDDAVDRFFLHLKKNATIVALGLKVSVALKQFLSYTQTIDELNQQGTFGEYQAGKAFAIFMSNPRKWAGFINERSQMMSNRRKQWDRDIFDMMVKFNPDRSKFGDIKHGAQEAFFYLIGSVDALATYPTWLAGYNVGLKKFKGDEVKAIDFGDRMVRKTQPMGSPKDMAAIQRGRPLQRMFVMFYTFFSKFYNRMADLALKKRLGKINMAQAARSFWWLAIVPALAPKVASSLFWKGELPEKEEVAAELVSYWSGAIPFVRDGMSSYLSGFDYAMTPLEQALAEPVNFGRTVSSEEVHLDRVRRSMTKMAGYGFGLPASQMNVFMDGVISMWNGEAESPVTLFVRAPREE